MGRGKKMLVVGVGLLAMAGCSIDPRDYETTPVDLETSKGVVTCQLYTKERVIWDRAIDRPDGMTVEEADQICRVEGQRLAAEA